VGNSNTGIRDQFKNQIGYLLDVTNPVVNKEHLPAPSQLVAYRITDLHFVKGVEFGGDRLSVGWWVSK